jgi:hypothetical protein
VCTACKTVACISNSAGGQALYSCGMKSCAQECANGL